MKKVLIWLCILLILIPTIPYVPIQKVDATEYNAPNAKAATSNIQTLKVPVISKSVEANPYVAYWELDNGRFRVTNNYTGDKEVASSGGLPIVTEMAQRLYMDDYPADHYYIKEFGEKYKYSNASVSNKHIIGITEGTNTTSAYSEPPAHTSIIAYSKTGGNDPERYCQPYNSTGKLECKYPYSFVLHYSGELQVSKRITAQSDAIINVGSTVNVTASIATKEGENGTFGAESDVSFRTDETVWNSDNQKVATVDSTGKVTGHEVGTANICATWTKEEEPYGKWEIVDCVVITVIDDGPNLIITGDANACLENLTPITLKLSVQLTKSDGTVIDLSSGHPNLKFTSLNNSLATVSPNGLVTIKGIGVVVITATFIDKNQGIEETANFSINVTDCTIPPDIPNTDCIVEISEPTNSDKISSDPESMLADPVGSILEDKSVPTSAVFNVLEYGISSDEYLKLWGETEHYLSDFEYIKKVGKVTYNIPVEKSYFRSWLIEYRYSCGDTTCIGYTPHSDTVVVNTVEEDVFAYSYWEIGHLVIYELQDLTFENYALPNGITIVDNDRHYIIVDAKHSKNVEDHVFPKACEPYTLPPASIGTPIGGPPQVPMDEFYAEAEEKIKETRDSRIPDVKNDYVKIKVTSDGESISDEVFMDDVLVPSHGPKPTKIPKADKVSLEKVGNYIDAEKINKWSTESFITANYKLNTNINKTPDPILSFKNSSYDDKINTVTVHTPVTMYAQASDDKAHDQRTNPPLRKDLSYSDGDLTVQSAEADTDRHAFILDRPFTVVLPTKGQHLDDVYAPGYGDRDFAKYYKDKQVRFPFDVYTETKAGYYPADTWISVPVDNESATFFMPVWVPEGEYTVEYRGVAINAPDEHVENNSPKEHHANLNESFRVKNEMMDHHIAYDTIEVDVVGRLYDMRISDVLDYEWQDVFRSRDGLLSHTGNYYWVGTNEIDGAPRGNNEPMVLPIRNGSHALAYPNEKLNVAIKTGYQFRFDMKTKGNMFNGKDAIRIKPTFDFVSKDGSRTKVDLYYHNDDSYFVKVGSAADKEYRDIILNERLRAVPKEDLIANADYIYRNIETYNSDYKEIYEEVGGIKESFINRYLKDISQRKIQTGPYGFQLLTQPLNTFIGPEEDEVPNCNGDADCTMVAAEDIVAREQQWYGEYSLPANVYVVEKQYDEDGKEIEQNHIADFGWGNQLDDRSSIFKKDGYIVVNFNIETIVDGDTDNSHLTYHTSPIKNAPLNNQWKMEGFAYEVVDGYGVTHKFRDGDMVYYHADRSSFDDFNSNVTH